jgi:hypothetical protein
VNVSLAKSKNNSQFCTPPLKEKREKEKGIEKIKAKKVLEKRKRFLPLQTQTEGSSKEEKK